MRIPLFLSQRFHLFDACSVFTPDPPSTIHHPSLYPDPVRVGDDVYEDLFEMIAAKSDVAIAGTSSNYICIISCQSSWFLVSLRPQP